jgi:hypothetical protein
MTTRVYREDSEGRLVPVEQIGDPEKWPTAGEVVQALRHFLAQSSTPEDRILLTPAQARVVVELADEVGQQLRRLADRIAPQEDKPAAVQDAAQRPAGRAGGCFS